MAEPTGQGGQGGISLIPPTANPRPLLDKPPSTLENIAALPEPQFERWAAAVSPEDAAAGRALRAQKQQQNVDLLAAATPTPVASPVAPSPGGSVAVASPEKIRLGSLSPAGAGPGGLVPEIPIEGPAVGEPVELPIQEPPGTRPWGDLDVGVEEPGQVAPEDVVFAAPAAPVTEPITEAELAVPLIAPVGEEPVEPVEGAPLGFPEVAPGEREEAEALADDPSVVAYAARLGKIVEMLPKPGAAPTSADSEAYDRAITAAEEENAAQQEVLRVGQEGLEAKGAKLTEIQAELKTLETDKSAAATARKAELEGVMEAFEPHGEIENQYEQAQYDQNFLLQRSANRRSTMGEMDANVLKNWQTEYDELKQAASDFKRTDYWDDKSTGDKILATIALFLGGVGAGMTGTPNFAMQIINKKVDDDIARQKAEYEKLTGAVTEHKSLYSLIRERQGASWDRLMDEENILRTDFANEFDQIDRLRDIAKERVDLTVSKHDQDRMAELTTRQQLMEQSKLVLDGMDISAASAEKRAQYVAMGKALDARIAETGLEREQFLTTMQENKNQFTTNLLFRMEQSAEGSRQSAAQLAQRGDIAKAQAGVQALKIWEDRMSTQDYHQLLRELKAGELSTRIRIAMLAASSRAAGKKSAPASVLMQGADITSVRESLADVRADFKDKTGVFSLFTGMIPGTSANIYNETRKNFVIAYLKAIQGSRPSDYDMKFYMELIPAAKTLGWKADAMFDALERTIINRENAINEAFELGGQESVDALNNQLNTDSRVEVTLADGTKGFVSQGVVDFAEQSIGKKYEEYGYKAD